MRAFVDFLIDEFASFMESSGWGLVWNRNGTPKNEEAAQTAFEAFARAASRMADVDLTREAGTGRGPVDFKFSRGSLERVVLEVKLASNERLEHGMRVQTPIYADAQGTTDARVVVIAQQEPDFLRAVRMVPDVCADVSSQGNLELLGRVISAMKPLSASKSRRRGRHGRVYLPEPKRRR